MQILIVVIPFLLLGVAVIFVAFSGGPARARQVYMTRGGRLFRVAIPLLYLLLGIGVPAGVIAARSASAGGVGPLKDESLTAQQARGKQLFRQTCSGCHTLAAVDARGVTGPDLDNIGPVTKTRVLNAIRIGGTGDKRMPAGLLQGADAQAVASYVSRVAGQ
jgi:mono/diheme cytochrome c family protein